MDADIAVIGGGLVGLITAKVLALQGYHVLVFIGEHPSGAVENRSFGLTQGSLRRLEDLGIPLDHSTGPVIEAINLFDEQHHVLSMHAENFGVSVLGINMPYKNLYEQLSTPHPKIRLCAVAIKHLEKERADWICVDSEGTRWKVPFVIGADGRSSCVRESLKINFSYYHQFIQKAHVCLFKCSPVQKPTHAIQWSLDNQLIGILPYAEDMRYVVCTTPADSVNWREIATKSSPLLGPIQEILPQGLYPLYSYHVSRQTDRAALLLGLAAKSFHPAAALGLNQSIYEIALFNELVKNKMMLANNWQPIFESLIKKRSDKIRYLTSALATPWSRKLIWNFPMPSSVVRKKLIELIL